MKTKKATSVAFLSCEHAYDTAIRNAEMQYKSDKDACGSRSGNAKDACVKEADATLTTPTFA